jgi:biotin carboxylase
MSNPVVVVVEPYSSAALLGPVLREAGFSPVAVTNPAAQRFALVKPHRRLEDYDVVVNHLGDLEGTISRLAALEPIAVIPCAERSLDLAQHLADALAPETTNESGLLEARRHKFVMHQAVAAAGLPIIRQICTSEVDEVESWIEREGMTGQDLVIKSPSSAGTVGVNLSPGGAGWRERFVTLLGGRDKRGVLNEQLLVQELMTGTEYVVDTVSSGGRHSVTDLMKYRKVRLGEGMAVYDSIEWIPYDTDTYGELIDYGLAALDAVGLRHWAAHTEIMMTPNGPRLVEINPRLSGLGSPEVTLMATGENQVTRIVDVCAGRGAQLPTGFTLRRPFMVVFLIAHSTGVVRNAEILDRIKLLPSYHSPYRLVKNGDRVEAPTDVWTSYMMGFIILTHERVEQMYDDRLAIRDLEQDLIIETVEPFVSPPGVIVNR